MYVYLIDAGKHVNRNSKHVNRNNLTRQKEKHKCLPLKWKKKKKKKSKEINWHIKRMITQSITLISVPPNISDRPWIQERFLLDKMLSKLKSSPHQHNGLHQHYVAFCHVFAPRLCRHLFNLPPPLTRSPPLFAISDTTYVGHVDWSNSPTSNMIGWLWTQQY